MLKPKAKFCIVNRNTLDFGTAKWDNRENAINQGIAKGNDVKKFCINR